MYHKYCEGKKLEDSQEEERQSQLEFMRQREHLERTVAGLKKLYSNAMVKNNTKNQTMMKVKDHEFFLM